MKPGFALSLSAEGIVLLHRAAGGWRNVGTVPLDSADLPAALAELRAKGETLEPGGTCKLIIPNDQIRYLTIDTGISDLESRRRLAMGALEGATPYAVADLAFDLSEDGSRTHVAAVARETLKEAESFALDHGFAPASFVAIPGEMEFLGEPFFGTAASLGAVEVEPDGIAVVDIGPADLPEVSPTAPVENDPQAKGDTSGPAKAEELREPELTLPKAPAQTTPSSDAADADKVPPAPEEETGPVAGFSSRRRKTDSPPPPLAGATRNKPTDPAPTAAPKAAPAATKAAPAASNKSAAAPVNGGAGSAPAATVPVAPVATKAASDTTQSATGSAAAKTAPAVSAAAAKSEAPSAPAMGGKPTKAVAATQASASLEMEGTKGKPRFLGLILTVTLLLVMAAVAAFALFSEGGLFFSGEQTPQEQSSPQEDNLLDDTSAAEDQQGLGLSPTTEPGTAIVPEDEQLLSDANPDASGIAPQVSAIADQPDPGIVELSEPELDPTTQSDTGTDASTGETVLDAFDEDVTEEELSAAALYAATGIWQQVPQIAEAPALVSLGDIYVASIDNSDLSQDAVALPPAPTLLSDAIPDAVSSPAAAGSQFDLDERGLVKASPEGTLNPDGVMIYLGRPSVVPPPTPARPDSDASLAEAENSRIASLSLLRPRPRPTDLAEQAERALLGGLTREELAKLRPRARPAGIKTEAQESQPVSSLAVATSVQPRARPANFANLVDRATRSRATAAATENAVAAATVLPPPSVTPSIPSSASVARQATVNNAINLRRLNLIGVSGKPSNRQALVRLPNGRYRKVRVGDRLDGGTVVAIGDSQLQYQKRGTNTTLKLPGS